MSCGNPATDPDALMQKRTKYDRTKSCVKCKDAKGNIVVRHAVYCKNCFMPLVSHKFRRTLEPTVNPKPDGPRRTALKPAGNLVIGFSGGLGSSVLLDMVHKCYVALDKSTLPTDGGRDHPRHERMWKKITVCYVEVCDAFSEMKDRTDEITSFVARYNDLDLVPLRIRDAFDPSWWQKTTGQAAPAGLGVSFSDEALLLDSLSNPDMDSLTALRAYLSSLPTPTAVHTSIQTLIRVLLLHTALHTNASHLVLGTSLTTLAVSLISGVAQGAGYNVREESQEEWSPDPELLTPISPADADLQEGRSNKQPQRKRSIRVVRPLRDIGMKECSAWAWWSAIPIVGKQKWVWPGAKPGIGTLTKEFILGLEQDYPSTVSTIVRTCGKLAPKGAVAGKCILCGRPVQAGAVQDWKARISIRTLPSAPSGDSSHARPAHTIEQTEDPTAAAVPHPSLAPHLCYACHTTLTSRSARTAPLPWPKPTGLPLVPLPVWTENRLSAMVNNTAADTEEHFGRGQKMDRDEMKGIVDQFLLDD